MWHVVADAELRPPGRLLSEHASHSEALEAMHAEWQRLQSRPVGAGFNWEADGVDLMVIEASPRNLDLEQSAGTVARIER